MDATVRPLLYLLSMRNVLAPSLRVAIGIFFTLGLTACGDDTSSSGEGGSGTTAGSTTAGTTTGTTSSGTSASTGGQCIAFGEACTMGDTCCAVGATPGECFAFGMGPRCTIPCPPDPNDCPNNGAGCNTMNPPYCKAQ